MHQENFNLFLAISKLTKDPHKKNKVRLKMSSAYYKKYHTFLIKDRVNYFTLSKCCPAKIMRVEKEKFCYMACLKRGTENEIRKYGVAENNQYI